MIHPTQGSPLPRVLGPRLGSRPQTPSFPSRNTVSFLSWGGWPPWLCVCSYLVGLEELGTNSG